MNIIIAGHGKVGSTLTRQLSAEGHNITLIDSSPRIVSDSVERYDVMAVHGNCATMDVLKEAGVADADLLIAATNADEINMLCCTTAHGINPKIHTIGRIRNPEYTEQIYALRDIFGLSMAINPEKQAAAEIEKLLKFPGFLRRDVFAKGRTEIVDSIFSMSHVDGSVRHHQVPGSDLRRSPGRCGNGPQQRYLYLPGG